MKALEVGQVLIVDVVINVENMAGPGGDSLIEGPFEVDDDLDAPLVHGGPIGNDRRDEQHPVVVNLEQFGPEQIHDRAAGPHVTPRASGEYTGSGRFVSVSLLALLLLLGWPGSAVADTPLWSMVPLPGGRAALLPRLGLRADVPRAIAIAEIIRVVHQARDPRGPAYTALETYLASPPPSGDELVPFPLPPAVWRDHVLGRAVDDQHLLGAILLDHRAALICYGLYGLDEQTLAFLVEQPSVLRRLYEQDATAFASFAHLLHVRGTALELPGGHEAAAIWEQLLGAPLSDPAAAITALLTHDNGRLAYFAEACSTLDSVRVRHLFPGGKTFKASVAATRAIARAFIDVDAARNLTDLPFQRVAYDPAHLLEQLPIGPDGLDGTDNYWRALLDNTDVPEDGAAEWTDLNEGPAGDLAQVLNRLAGLPYEARHDLIVAVSFAGRLSRRMPSATPADRVYLTHACMRYPALMLTLERMGIDQLDTWNAVVTRAALLDRRVSSRDASEDPLVLFQAAVALVDRAMQARSLDRAGAAAALTALAAVDTGEADGARRLAQWIETTFLPASSSARNNRCRRGIAPSRSDGGPPGARGRSPSACPLGRRRLPR